jgi:RsiW-degrading membrane proteinase PrsW (M82 family)
MQDLINALIGLVGFALAIIFYFLPSFIASSRKHQNTMPIVIVNAFLGWTLIGWVICLAWSLSQVTAEAS